MRARQTNSTGRTVRSFVADVRAGAITGLIMAVPLTGLAFVSLSLSGGAYRLATGLTFLTTSVLYLSTGVLGGAIAGALLPFGRTNVGAALVGFLALLPFQLAYAYVRHAGDGELAEALIFGVGAALGFGCILGIGMRNTRI